MALLPKVPRRGEVLQGPQSRVGPGTIQTPYSVVAGLLADAGQQLTDWATARASTEGQNAVTRDENGNLQVRRMSDLTQVGRAYNRAAQQAYLARLSGDIETSAQQLAIEANGNVDAFRSSWEGYAQRTLEGVDPALRGAVSVVLEDIGGQQFRGISANRYEADMREYRDGLLAQRQRLAAQILTLASQGGLDTTDGQRLLAQYRDLGTELADNPAFGISAEAQRWTDDQFMADVAIEAASYEVMQRYPLDPVGGMAYAREVVNDPNLALSPEERRTALAQIERQYTSTTAAYAQQVAELNAEIDDLLDRWEKGLPVDDQALFPALLSRAEELNAFTAIARLEVAARQRDLILNLEATDPETRLNHWDAASAWARGDTQAFLSDRGPGITIDGFNPDFGYRLTLAIQAAEAATGQRVTLVSGVRSDTEQAQIYANSTVREDYPYPVVYQGVTYFADPNNPVGLAAAPGTSRHQSGQAADIAAGPALDWLHEHAAEFGLSFLSGDAFTIDPGHIQLASDNGVPFNMDTEALAAERELLQTDLGNLLDQYDVMLGRNWGLSADDIHFATELAIAVDNPELTARTVELIYQSAGRQAVSGPGATQQQIEAEVARLLADAADQPRGDRYLSALIDQGRANAQAQMDALHQTNPVLEGQQRGYYTIAPIDWAGDTESVRAGLATRQSQVAGFARDMDYGPLPLLQPEEAASLARVFAEAPADQRIGIVAAFADTITDPAVLDATLAQFVRGDAHLLAVAGSLYRDAPAVAEGMLRGQQLLAANPDLAPKPADWTEAIEEALPRSVLVLQAEGAWLDLGNAIRLRYVDLAYRAGQRPSDGIDTTLLDRATQEVTGGLVEFNGQSIIAPERGMTQRDFDQVIRTLPEEALAHAVTADGVPIPASLITTGAGRNGVRLRSVADGQYLIQFGNDEIAFFAFDDRTGEPFRLDLGAVIRGDYAPGGAQGPIVVPTDAGVASPGPTPAPAGVTLHGLDEVGPPPAFEELTLDWVRAFAEANGQDLQGAVRDLGAFYRRSGNDVLRQITPAP